MCKTERLEILWRTFFALLRPPLLPHFTVQTFVAENELLKKEYFTH